jgi:ankyrin repeat protein
MEIQNRGGETALHYAIYNHHSAVARALLERGATVGAELLRGLTAKRVKSKNLDMLKRLLIETNRAEDCQLLMRVNPWTEASQEIDWSILDDTVWWGDNYDLSSVANKQAHNSDLR